MNPEMQKLLEDVKNGISLSFEAVYVLYTPLINSLSEKYRTSFGLSGEELQDLRQEAAIALYDAALSYNADRGVSFGLYAKICIKNRIVSFMRSIYGTSVRTESLENTDDIMTENESTPEKLIISKESLSDMKKEIDLMLTEFERSVFDLYLAAASYDDIAAALGKPKKSIDNAMQRIKAKLRKLL